MPSPETGDAYGVGTEAPYSIYVFDGVTGAWKDNGHLSGGGGGPLPENVVTAEGGASMSFPIDLGDGPHTITFVDEEGPPLTAGDIAYEMGTVEDALDGLKSSVSNGKSLIASAITDKGVDTAQDATFQQMAENIGQISGGSDTSDATATSFDILAPKTAYTANGKVAGVIPTLAAQTITPGTADKTISNGQYLGGTQTIKGDPNLTSSNIKRGVTLFGVAGALESSFKATLTATADIGAVVTATHSGGTEVEALSTTGTVVLELPLEGTWSVTAVRGTAQYNTVTLQVSSQYSAALTAEVHIIPYASVPGLSARRYHLAAASVGGHALFGGGATGHYAPSALVDTYDEYLTRGTAEELGTSRHSLAAAAIGAYALFLGGYHDRTSSKYMCGDVDVYDGELVHSIANELSSADAYLSATTIGGLILVGGITDSGLVDTYDTDLTRGSAPPLVGGGSSYPGAGSNENYAMFCSSGKITAYDRQLVRTIAADPDHSFSAAARAGGYVLFTGAEDVVNAYDLFLTRIIPEPLGVKRKKLAGTTLEGYAIFAGGTYSSDTIYYYKDVDIYDPFLTRTTTDGLGRAKINLAAASVAGFALFGGGAESGGSANATVTAYQYV